MEVPPDLVRWLEDLKPRFKDALEEQRKTSEENPEKEPFKSKYAAREVLLELLRACEAKLDGTEESAQGDSVFSYISGTIGILALHLGANYIDAEETSEGEKYLSRARRLLEPVKLSPRYCNAFVRVAAQEGILWSNRNDHQKALDKLSEAEDTYRSYVKRNRTEEEDKKGDDGAAGAGAAPWLATELIPASPPDECWADFEAAHTHTCYYLAQCYMHLGQQHRGAEYVQFTLRRQRETGQYHALDWAVNCAALSQYYLGQSDYAAASHCLLSAAAVAHAAESADEEEKQDKIAQINRCWIKYALNLMKEDAADGKDEGGGGGGKDGSAAAGAEGGGADGGGPAVAAALQFGVDVDEAERASVPTKAPANFAEAKAVFQLGQRYVTLAVKTLTLDGHVTDHIEVLQDSSRLYEALVPFLDDPDSKCKLHKRRLDLLTGVAAELSPQYYLLVTRQLQYEIAETSVEMMRQKRSKYTDANPPDAKASAKINKLGMQSIKWYTAFMDSCRDTQTKEIPQDLDEAVVRPFLVAKFNIARIYSQLLVSSPAQYAENMAKCQEGYTWCVKYCDDHPDYKGFEEEYTLCKEMARMIPDKVRRTLAAMGSNAV